MLFRQLTNHHSHQGSVAGYYFVKRKRISLGIFLLTKEDNGWDNDDSSSNHYTNFKLEIVL